MPSLQDILSLWDYGDPEASEARFRAAYAASSEAGREIYLVQIARTLGLRKRFAEARELLESVQNLESLAGFVRAWYFLEWGRSLVSAAHVPGLVGEHDRAEARRNYERCIEIAEAEGLDYLVVDAMHMMVMVDPEPKLQLEWNRKTLARVEASNEALVKKWLGPLYNNLGYALHLDGLYDEALEAFAQSKKAYAERGDGASVRIENWMIAWTYRAQGRLDEALELQLENERAAVDEGSPSPYVYQELSTLYREKGEIERSHHYAELAKKASSPAQN